MPPTNRPPKSVAPARDVILRRRAHFVALAVASSGVLGSGAACVCLSVAPPTQEPTADEPTAVVLDSAAPDNAPGGASTVEPPDAGAGAAPDGGLPQASPPVGEPGDAGFRLCLSFDELEPEPAVCLRAPDEEYPRG